MVATAVPVVVTALIDGLTAALPTVDVRDSWTDTADPGDFLMVGVEDPDAVGYESSATAEQEWATIGNYSREESGEVVCCALSWNGDADPAAARAAAYGVVDAVAAWLKGDPTMGVTSVVNLRAEFAGRHTLNQARTDVGAVALVTFTVSFKARV